ncbi:hypothetical protein [Paraburkholderia susongensis]|uniref:Uncharacterized protein n=1 Tax=Paraburkholderia susongensis TaxID=1515439 RepID=A0A1X7LCC4_9BURK|nr:hypothetical protein [Paraburkholderia susongensis]SMG50922.1 hypothetical protein SAMN06265784_105347 [Paraburkholderia susongensis]
MHEPAASTPVLTNCTFARVSAAVDALSGAIAGFALLAGARAFMFMALLGWREPVLGGAGLVLLAMVGWLRWQCSASVDSHAARCSGSAMACVGGVYPIDGTHSVFAHAKPGCAEVRNPACYNRSAVK